MERLYIDEVEQGDNLSGEAGLLDLEKYAETNSERSENDPAANNANQRFGHGLATEAVDKKTYQREEWNKVNVFAHKEAPPNLPKGEEFRVIFF